MSNRPKVVLRINAATDSLFIDDKEFDRSKMTKEERGVVRRRIRNWRFPRGQR